ncbi:hypothetical protein LINPERHAP2_LOCUS22764, partial [Linum perenne]
PFPCFVLESLEATTGDVDGCGGDQLSLSLSFSVSDDATPAAFPRFLVLNRRSLALEIPV